MRIDCEDNWLYSYEITNKKMKILLKTQIIFASYSSWNTIIYDSGCILEPLVIDSEELKHHNAVVWRITLLVNGEYYYARYTAEKDNSPFIVLENE